MPAEKEDSFSPPRRRPSSERPLLGLTVLVVEDSRFACEAMRLLCLRSGARIRRADCLASAHRHLAVYRPTAVVIDMGLPDGSGSELIAELNLTDPRVPVILATSGDSSLAAEAFDAGADGFLEKPISDLLSFQHAVLSHLPSSEQPTGPRYTSRPAIDPDPIALKDDLTHITDILAAQEDSEMLDYVAQFLASIAASATDAPLAQAAQNLREVRKKGSPPAGAIAQINALVGERLTGTGPI